MTCLAGWMITMALLAVIGAVMVWREYRSLIAMIDDEGETFQLSREPERAERREVSVEPERRQKVLFSGLQCLAGQLDLFETDGTDTGPQPEDETMTTMTDIRSEIRALEQVEHLIETNEGTYSAADAHRAIGTGDPQHADYRIYERVGGGRRTVGCDPQRAPGYARTLEARGLIEDRRRLAELRRQLTR